MKIFGSVGGGGGVGVGGGGQPAQVHLISWGYFSLVS